MYKYKGGIVMSKWKTKKEYDRYGEYYYVEYIEIKLGNGYKINLEKEDFGYDTPNLKIIENFDKAINEIRQEFIDKLKGLTRCV